MNHRLVSASLLDYTNANNPLSHAILEDIERYNHQLPDSGMQTPAYIGRLLHMLVSLRRPKWVLELGCFTGYSSVCMATALSEGSRLVTIDHDKKTNDIARGFFARAGLENKIELLEFNAQVELQNYLNSRAEAFDFVFVDADKLHYPEYLQILVPFLSSNGLLVFDNVFRNAEVLSPAPRDLPTQAVVKMTAKAFGRSDLIANLIPIADGLLCILKK
jgi:predicted O-methyltransferase YrrM